MMMRRDAIVNQSPSLSLSLVDEAGTKGSLLREPPTNYPRSQAGSSDITNVTNTQIQILKKS